MSLRPLSLICRVVAAIAMFAPQLHKALVLSSIDGALHVSTSVVDLALSDLLDGGCPMSTSLASPAGITLQ